MEGNVISMYVDDNSEYALIVDSDTVLMGDSYSQNENKMLTQTLERESEEKQGSNWYFILLILPILAAVYILGKRKKNEK